MRVTPELANTASESLAELDPVEILRRVHATFGSRAAILSSMQRAGAALCHMADRAGLDFDVLFVDTGVLHQETLRARARLAETHPRLRVRSLSPSRSFADQTRDEGLLYLSKEGQERCCALRKSAPLLAVRGEYDVLVGALRRAEGGRRSTVELVALDPEMNAIRVHPFADYSETELEAYCNRHSDVVINELHRMGFPTIGCFPCTTPVRPDEPERAGRWRHLSDVAYCGINPTDSGTSGAIETLDRYEEFFTAAPRGASTHHKTT